jgi:hypothetical protein
VATLTVIVLLSAVILGVRLSITKFEGLIETEILGLKLNPMPTLLE